MAEPTPDRVRLSGMRFRATHGVYDFERVEPQDFVVDVSCELARPAQSDELSSTVDYAELASAIGADVTGEPVNLIETLAERIAATCLSRPQVQAVQVTVHKPGARMPVELTDIAVTINRRHSR